MMAARDGVDLFPSPRFGWRVRDADGREDAYYMLTLWHHYFGTEYQSTRLPAPLAEIAGWRSDDDEPIEVYGVIAEHEGVRIGAGLAECLDHEATVDELPDGGYDAAALAGHTNVWLWFGVVDPAWRGLGIGRRLFRRRLDWADAIGADMTFAYGWERRDGRTSRPLFEGHGFVPVETFPDYYGEDQAQRSSCPDCGVWPSDDQRCECEMTLWARDEEVNR